jgi:peptide/nickel transport system substrate-binding protein
LNTRESTPAPQLLDVRVRKAIMYAIDRERIAKFVTGLEARVLHSECHPRQFGCTDVGVPRYEYNPLMAKQLLAEAGYNDGFDIDFYTYRDRNQAEAIIGYLAAVGIRARLRFIQAGAIRSARRAGRLSLSFGVSNAIADDISDSASRGHEFSPDDINRDAEVRDLMLRGDTSIDPDLRKASYAKALALIQERAYVLPLYSIPTYYLVTKDLVIKPYADNILRFWDMSYR